MDVENDDQKPRTNSHANKWIMDWRFDDNFARDQMLLGFELSNHRPSPYPCVVTDLLQNCDLPPPLKVFSPIPAEEDLKKKKKTPIPSDLPLYSKVQKDHEKDELGTVDHGEDRSLSLLRALQRSQTRAREAEKKASQQSVKIEQMSRILLEDSLKVSAYKQWVRLLEVEISMLKTRGRSKFKEKKEEEELHGGGDGWQSAAKGWWLTLALCVSFAGVGFALGFFTSFHDYYVNI